MMALNLLSDWAISCLLLSLRTVPVFAFAPPFTLMRIPRRVLLLLGMGISTSLVSLFPMAMIHDATPARMAEAAARELMLGIMFVLAFQLVFAALQFVGRAIDIQAGFGLALVIDPSSRTQAPLTGMLFAYAAGAVFFAMDGHLDLLRLLGASMLAVPLGGWTMPASLTPLLAYISTMFITAFGVAGGTMLALFLTDIAITLLSRTVPQMNVLVLGFQVKTIAMFLALPIAFGFGGAIFVRMVAMIFEALPGLV